MNMNKIKDTMKHLSFMLSIPALNVFYLLLNNPYRGVHSLVTDIDRSLPFLSIFILPYSSWSIFIFATLTYLCLRDRKTYYNALASVNISLIICYLIYFFYQTTVPRPVLVGDDIFTQMVTWVYRNDQPFNCFPSIHCLLSYLMIVAINTSKIKNKKNSFIICGIASLIILSTLFVKQHVLLDAIAAMLLGEIIYKAVYNFDQGKVLQWTKRPSLLWVTKRKYEI